MTDPGYVDAHVHLRDAGGLADAGSAGVVSVRDAGTREGAGLRVSGPDTPTVISAGWALCKRGGYGSLFGVSLDSREQIAEEILKLKQAGAGIIKVIASDMVSLKRPGEVTVGGFDREELRFLVETARKNGLEVMAHANGEAAILNAAEAGVRSVEHGFFMTEKALASLHANGVFWVPTIGALQRAAEQPDVGQEAKQFVERTLDEHLVQVRKAYERGVPLAIGTDAVLPDRRYASYYEAELTYLRRAGIPRDAVLAIACKGGKKLLGVK
ncbi:MAG: amidohydrolase family protein [Nitrospirota bacterium]